MFVGAQQTTGGTEYAARYTLTGSLPLLSRVFCCMPCVAWVKRQGSGMSRRAASTQVMSANLLCKNVGGECCDTQRLNASGIQCKAADKSGWWEDGLVWYQGQQALWSSQQQTKICANATNKVPNAELQFSTLNVVERCSMSARPRHARRWEGEGGVERLGHRERHDFQSKVGIL